MARKHAGLSDLIDEARKSYGNDHIIVNKGTEDSPNWQIVYRPQKGSGGIKEIDIFDR
ncbi:DUF4148 domain-containing protein [Bacillus cereus]|uniref:DUF4148 domain-containing protein n=1 Tax=Bacillus cereus TaxID=1396 RepID=UPI001145BF1F|nr:DUF4148 domain-containing protein [Bacillus cereus]